MDALPRNGIVTTGEVLGATARGFDMGADLAADPCSRNFQLWYLRALKLPNKEVRSPTNPGKKSTKTLDSSKMATGYIRFDLHHLAVCLHKSLHTFLFAVSSHPISRTNVLCVQERRRHLASLYSAPYPTRSLNYQDLLSCDNDSFCQSSFNELDLEQYWAELH